MKGTATLTHDTIIFGGENPSVTPSFFTKPPLIILPDPSWTDPAIELRSKAPMAEAVPSLDRRQAESHVRPRPTTSLADPPGRNGSIIPVGYHWDIHTYTCIYIYICIHTQDIDLSIL